MHRAITPDRACHGHVEGQRQDVVFAQAEADLLERLDDLVTEGTDRRDRRVGGELAAGAYGPLLLASRDACEPVDDVAVLVAAEAEVDLQRAVLLRDRDPDLLGPGEVRLGDGGEGVDDLVVEGFVDW